MTSSEEIEGIMEILKSLEESGFFMNGVRGTIEYEVKEQKRQIFLR